MYFIPSGIVSALQRGLLEVPGVLVESITQSILEDTVYLLEKITLLLLGVLYGDQDTEEKGILKLQIRSNKLSLKRVYHQRKIFFLSQMCLHRSVTWGMQSVL